MARGGGETCKLMHRPGGTFSNQVGTTLSWGSNMPSPPFPDLNSANVSAKSKWGPQYQIQIPI